MANDNTKGFSASMLDAVVEAANETGFVRGLSYAAKLAWERGDHAAASQLCRVMESAEKIKTLSGQAVDFNTPASMETH